MWKQKQERFIYTIRAAVAEYPEDSWRTLQILSDQTVGELGAAVLAAFESAALHAWNIEAKDRHYEYDRSVEEEKFFESEGVHVINPETRKIESLALKEGDRFSMEYDYGTPWQFVLAVEKIEPAVRTGRTFFPRLIDGKGGNMRDDTSPYDLHQLMQYQKSGETLADHPELLDLIEPNGQNWRYDDFELTECQKDFGFLYDRVRAIYAEYY